MKTLLTHSGKIVLASFLVAGSVFLASSFANTQENTETPKAPKGELREIFSSLSEEQKSELKEIKKSGTPSDAVALLESYGVEIPERLQKRAEKHNAIQQAVESNDYTAFAEAVADTPLSEKITLENFETFKAFHTAKTSGDTETARQLAQELGLKKFQKRGARGEGRKHNCPNHSSSSTQ